MTKQEFLDNIKTQEGLETVAKYFSELARTDYAINSKLNLLCPTETYTMKELHKLAEGDHSGDKLGVIMDVHPEMITIFSNLTSVAYTERVELPMYVHTSMDFTITPEDLLKDPRTLEEIILAGAIEIRTQEDSKVKLMLELAEELAKPGVVTDKVWVHKEFRPIKLWINFKEDNNMIAWVYYKSHNYLLGFFKDQYDQEN